MTELSARGGYRRPRPEEFSNWRLVLEECRTRTKIEDFLLSQVADTRFVVVHIDTAEAQEPGYDIDRSDRGRADYCDTLRALVVAKLAALLGPDLSADVRYAIAIEETDAWVLTIHDKQDRRDTSARLHPKERLEHLLGKPRPDLYDARTRDFRKSKPLEACAARNRSLRLFLDSLALPEPAAPPP